MDFQTSFRVLLVLFIGLISSSQAYNFYVGGKDGWTINPYEKYNHWAERNRFSINDTLTFKYKNGSDSVLVVSKDDYYKCNTEKPILRMDGGDSVFKFDKSGPFFFISGNKSSCEKGQRLIVIVLSERHHPSSPPPISQIPASAPSGTTPVSPSASPTSSPVYPPVYAPMPASWSPSPSPLASSPTPALSPMSPYPAPWSSTPSISPSPATSPTSASPSPSKSSPAPAPSSPVTSTPTPSQSETGGTPSDSTPAPSPAKASAPGLATPSALLMAAVVIVLSLTFGSN